MSIIIRLQNLPLEANSLDIRRFFQGLHIPDGGVHIVGGENGDAFIAFGTDEDARQAMERNGNQIKGSRIKLLLSSRNEMQRVIDAARNQTMSTNGLVQSQQPSIAASQPKPMLNVVGPPSSGQYPSASQQQPQPSQQQQPQQPPYPSSGPAMNQSSAQVSGYYQQSYGMINNQSNEKDSYREGPPPPGFRARSRSRSRSPPARRSYNEPSAQPTSSSSSSSLGQSSQTATSSMHTGLLGSLTSVSQQMPHQYPNSSYQNPSNIYRQEGPPPPQQPPNRDSFGYSGDGGRYPAPNNNSNMNQPPPPPQSQYSSDHWGNQSDDRFRASAPGIGGIGGSDDMFRKMDSLHQSHPSINNNNINNSNNNSYGGGNTGPQQAGYGHQQQSQQQMYLNNSNNNNSGSMDPLIQPAAAQSQFLPQTMPPSASQPSSSNNVRMFTLQLFDLPLNVRPIDLIKFFHPLFLNEDNIKIFYDEKGFPTGMALVRFPSPREFEAALGLNNRYLGERQIQIRPLDEMNGPIGGSSNSGSSVPINQINSSVPLISQKPLLKQNSPLMPTPPSASGNGGEPYRSDNYLPYRNPPTFNNHGPPSSQPGPPPPPPIGHRRKELVLYMKGLPFRSCSPKDVAEFFHPIKLANIKIEMDARDKPTGNAFVEFQDQTDLDRGMEYNMRHMGRRYIELIPLLMFEKYGPNYHSAPPPPKHGRPGAPPITFCVSVRGLSKHVTSKDLKAYFAKADAETYAVHIMLTPERMNAGEAFLEFINKENQLRALKMNGCYMGGDRITVRHVPFETVRKAVPPLSRAGEGFNPYPPSKPRSMDNKYRDRSIGGGGRMGGPPAFFDKATILIAKNISGKANEKDLCAFFSHYHITTNRIKLRDDPDDNNDPQSSSSPTQMAQISFQTKADAEHAQRNMDKKYLLERRIHLTFA